ncbi:MAG TPA: PhzF family phenazine biosynthesis protein [Chloroflexota bacterium]|nr:PhzF family phenazine biosynthesis protein [Chloroflexota bacterium]
MAHNFTLVDVFGIEAFSGNPLAVVHDADDLDTEEMLRITRWLNFSETTFLLRPTVSEADYRVRIFTPERELPFAGHPTLGTCHAWLAARVNPPGRSTIVQECGAGLVPVARRDSGLAFAAPPLIRSGPLDEPKIAETLSVLRIPRDTVVDIAWADNGPGWVAVLLRSADAVLALEPERWHASRVDIGVVGPYPEGRPAAFELRAFFSDHLGTIREDPVTGSLNASVAQWLLGTGRAQAPYMASQGTALGRQGRIEITRDDEGEIWVGGQARTLVGGQGDF